MMEMAKEQMLSFHDLFSDLHGVHRRSLSRGSTLFSQGEDADFVFFVESGELQLVRYTPDGHSVCLHTAYDGESFAEAALFTDKYHCNGEVIKDSLVWCYPRLKVLRKINSDQSYMQRFHTILAAQVRHLRFLMELRSIRSAPERVMQFLRMYADEKGTVRLRDTLYNTAQETGLAHETFYRAIGQLEKSGKIRREAKRTFTIL